MKKIKIGNLSDFPKGKMKAIAANGEEILVSNVNGKLHAIGNICTHEECELHKGTLKGNIVTCPCHFSQFDVTSGAVVANPATGESIEPEPMYEVKIGGNDVFVILE